ncbi:HotDog domain-containing protein [Gymnopilus junonius]|uniref:HotDog domain-containing protein n=1 Tax=Gymnopilus junonius TaxID=109634 RepID=A0A9P5TKJ2_GYMJU|nr:HotDog domain-containing protein [Gymnopilus junonius]
MSSTRLSAAAATSSFSTSIVPHESLPTSSRPRAQSGKAWVDPATLPHHDHESYIAGNTPDYVKQLNYNTFMNYGVGEEDCFGYKVGKAVRFTEVSVNRKLERQGRLEATTVAEIEVTKQMLNGAGMLHGGCVAYLIDNTPLVVLGLVQNVNGVGVTQSMNVLFHAPAPRGTCLQIVSTSIALGGRVMSSRCEILDKDTGRMVASAFLSKMQPAASKL